jgi:hypothetical protein
MSAHREPDDVLRQLGDAVEAAWIRRTRRPAWRRRLPARRGVLAALVCMLAIVPTAVATREALWAPEPPQLPPALRGPDALAPSRTGQAVYIAAGEAHGVAWRLSASACDLGEARVVGVFLTVPGGGAGARCDAASTQAPDAKPGALAARRVHTYFDPVAALTWVFGTVPPAARDVVVTTQDKGATMTIAAPAGAADPEAVAKGRLPSGLRVFVAAAAGAPEVLAVRATDETGATVLRCDGVRCAP